MPSCPTEQKGENQIIEEKVDWVISSLNTRAILPAFCLHITDTHNDVSGRLRAFVKSVLIIHEKGSLKEALTIDNLSDHLEWLRHQWPCYAPTKQILEIAQTSASLRGQIVSLLNDIDIYSDITEVGKEDLAEVGNG